MAMGMCLRAIGRRERDFFLGGGGVEWGQKSIKGRRGHVEENFIRSKMANYPYNHKYDIEPSKKCNTKHIKNIYYTCFLFLFVGNVFLIWDFEINYYQKWIFQSKSNLKMY